LACVATASPRSFAGGFVVGLAALLAPTSLLLLKGVAAMPTCARCDTLLTRATLATGRCAACSQSVLTVPAICARCGYDVASTPGRPCPECGAGPLP
jgi:hypothetical protein